MENKLSYNRIPVVSPELSRAVHYCEGKHAGTDRPVNYDNCRNCFYFAGMETSISEQANIFVKCRFGA